MLLSLIIFYNIIVRSFSLVFLGIESKQWLLAVTQIILWDLPTFFVVTSFSFFTYYIAKLNIEVERVNLMQSYGEFEEQIRMPLVNTIGRERPNIPRTMEIKRYRLNLLKPFFLFFNFLAFISFCILFFSCKYKLFQ